MSEDQTEIPQPLTNQWFATTHWTVVLSARGVDSPAADASLEQLCRTYWPALYAYARREGQSPADAADLTQAFFARLLEKHFLDDVDRSKGKFRSFLLKAFRHFVADHWKHCNAQKRAGSHGVISINADSLETSLGEQLATDETPERLFERRWALALFEQALKRMEEESIRAGRGREFELLGEFLSNPSTEGAYATAATQLGVSERTVAVQVHRLRRRYGQVVREQVAQTVGGLEEVEEELHHLLDVMSS